jgi:hypothetical protein
LLRLFPGALQPLPTASHAGRSREREA